MLATHLLLKSIKTQITLPFQRLNITIDIIRCKSSSSDSSSDSDSKSDTLSSNEISNESFKRTDYLQNATTNRKDRRIGKVFKETEKLLTTTPNTDKEKIISTFLSNLLHIKNSYDKNMSHETVKRQQNFKNTKVKYTYKNKMTEDKNRFKKEATILNTPSVINKLLQEQSNLENKPFIRQGTRFKKAQRQDFDLPEKRSRMTREPSVIRTLFKEKQKNSNTSIRKQYKENNDLKKNISNYKFKTKNSFFAQWKIQQDKNDVRYDQKFIGFNINLFHDPALINNIPKFRIWDKMEENKFQFIKNSFTKNAFKEMITWTEEGKLWKFPIDNEQGMEKEQNVHFSKHIFLEHNLTPWCPTKGPIRHFMELVCIGLSKNPYMTFQEKCDHITWYKNYFQDKEDILKNLGAIV